jgi:hypothetical protein
MTFQLGLAVIFFSIACFILINQYPREYKVELARTDIYPRDLVKPDPWKDDPWNFNPFDNKMHLIESYTILLCFVYGFLRLINILRIIIEDNNASPWEHFWEQCEQFT